MTRRSLAVIGGGASAVLLLAHLARRGDAGSLAVDLYDRTDRFGKGVAYSTSHDCHLLNVRAASMSAYQDERDHFAHWAASYGYQPLHFVPRKLYGRYLTQQLEQSEKIIAVKRIVSDVVSSKRSAGGFDLATKDGTLAYDQVVLASGNVRPLSPRCEGDAQGYFCDPWTANFETLLKARTIALIGSGLTAVDMVLALNERGYGGEILIFSRNALMPEPHVEPAVMPDFMNGDDMSPLEMLRFVRMQVKCAAAEDVPWQAVIDALRPHTNPLWQNWNAEQRRQFSKRLLTFWNVHRHRMAPQIADRVAALRDDGRLRMIKAGVLSVSSGPTVNSAVGPVSADAVINCLGYRYDEGGRDYDVSAKIGPPNFGDLFETTAIPEIRAQAHALAAKILP